MPHTQFSAALKKKDSKLLEQLIKQDQKLLQFVDEQGDTLVHHAIYWGNQGFLKFLLEQGAEPCTANKSGEEPLHAALQQADANVYLQLLRESLQKKLYKKPVGNDIKTNEVQVQNLGDPELAVELSLWEEVNLHLFHLHEQVLRGVFTEYEINEWMGPQGLAYWVDKANYTPLHLAAALGKQVIVHKILNNLTVDWLYIQNSRSQTPLLLAAKHGHLAVIQHLLDANLVNSENIKKQLSITDDEGNHILHYLVRGNTQRHTRALQWLLDKNQKDIYPACLELMSCQNKAAILPLQIAMHTQAGELEIFTSLFDAACAGAYIKIIREIFDTRVEELKSVIKKNIVKYYPAVLIKVIEEVKAGINSLNEMAESISTTRKEYLDSDAVNSQCIALEQLVIKGKLHKYPSEFNDDDKLVMSLLNIDSQIIMDHFDTQTFYYWAGFYGKFDIFNWLMSRCDNYISLLPDQFLQNKAQNQAGANNSENNSPQAKKSSENNTTIYYTNVVVPLLKESFFDGVNEMSAKHVERNYLDLSNGKYSERELNIILNKMKLTAHHIKIINLEKNSLSKETLFIFLEWIAENTPGLVILDLSYNVLGNKNVTVSDEGKKLNKLIETILLLPKLKELNVLNTRLKPEEQVLLGKYCNRDKNKIALTLDIPPSNNSNDANAASTRNNLAVQAFLGDGITVPSHLDFKTWYHPDICDYLLQSTPNHTKCIRVIFADAGYGDNTQTFKDQLLQLIMLGNKLQRPSIFISKEPGADNHFICGLINQDKLLFLNPLGITNKSDCYRTLYELKEEKTISEVWLSDNRLQKHLFEEEGLVSCGPMTIELAMHIVSQLAAQALSDFWNQLKINEPITHEKSGLVYHRVSITELLPETLKTLTQVNNEVDYQDQICRIREKHLQQLENLPAEKATDDYLKEHRGNAPAQVLFNALITQSKTINTVTELKEYALLEKELEQEEKLIGHKVHESSANHADLSIESLTANKKTEQIETKNNSQASKNYSARAQAMHAMNEIANKKIADKKQASAHKPNENTPLIPKMEFDMLNRYQEPGILGRIIRRWNYSLTLQNLIIRSSDLCCSSGCCNCCKSKARFNPLVEEIETNQQNQRSSKDVFASLADAHIPSIFQSRFAPSVYFTGPGPRRFAQFIEGYMDHFNWMLEKGWLMVLSAFIYKGLHDYFRMPEWQRERINILNLLVAKTVEERLASYVDNGTIYGVLLGVASCMGLLGGITKTIKQERRFQRHELEALKLHVLYQPHHPLMNILHEVLEMLEIPAVFLLLVLAPPIVSLLFLFKLKHLFKPGALEDLKYAVLWDAGLSIDQRSELFDVLLRACRTQRNLAQMEAVAAAADIVYHLNLKQLDILSNDPSLDIEQRDTIEKLRKMKRQGLRLLFELGHTSTQYGHCLNLGELHPRAINARYYLWRLGMETGFKSFISMIPLYLYSSIPRLVSFGLFAYTIIEGIKEKYHREHAAHECHEHHLQWRYVPSVGEYVCSPCSDLPIPYRYMQTNDLCIEGFLSNSGTLEQWNVVLNRLNFANFTEIVLSGQSQVIQQGQLPLLLSGLAAKAHNITTLILNNKFEEIYQLSAEDLFAIGNFTRAYTSFVRLELQYQNIGSVLNATQLGEFAASLHPDLEELIFSYNQLGRQNTSLFFKNLPSRLEYLALNSNDLNDQDGYGLAQCLLHLAELNHLVLSNNLAITDESGIALVSQLKHHKNLVAWELSDTKVGDATVLEFNKAIINSTLDHKFTLYMKNCLQLSDQGGLAFAHALKSNVSFDGLFITDNRNLTQTSLQAITDALWYARPLFGLGVGSSRFTDLGGVVNYLNTLETQIDLENLDLISMPLSAASSASSLATLIPKLPNLKILFLTNTQLNDIAFRLLLPALQKSKIETLFLDRNPALTDASIQALIAEPPINLQRLDLSGNNFTLINANSLGQLLHKVPLLELQLAHNRLGSQFMSRFAPYLPGSPLQSLGLSNCNLVDQDVLDLAEVLTEYQIPDDWLGSLDSHTLRSLAKGNPGTNISLIEIAFNAIGDIGAKRLCQVLPGTEISVNDLFLEGNPINASLLRECGSIGLDSPANHLSPGGPYVGLWRLLQKTWYATKQSTAKVTRLPQHFPTTNTIGTRVKAVLASQLSDLDLSLEQLQNCRNANFGQVALSVAIIPDRDKELHIINTSCEKIAQNFRAQHPMTERNPLASFSTTAYQTAASFLSGAGYVVVLTGLPNIGASVLQRMGMAEERARAWTEGLQQLLSLALLIWRSPSYALATLILGATLYRLCSDRNTASFLQLMATILLLTVNELWQKNHNLEAAALQMTASGLGAIGGQVVTPTLVKCSKNLWQSYSCFWKPVQKAEESNKQVETHAEGSSQIKLLGTHANN